MNGLETARRLRETRPQIKSILLTMHTDDHYVLEAVRAVMHDGLERERGRTGGLSQPKLGEQFEVHARYGSPCPRCGTPEMAPHLLPRRGTLWTFTTQEFLPKEPYASGETLETFRPYGVGIVQLGDEVRVEGRLTEADPAQLRIGMEVELGMVPFFVDEEGDEIMTIAFAPV